MKTKSKKIEGDFTIIANAILCDALEHLGHSHRSAHCLCNDLCFEIDTNVNLEAMIDIRIDNKKIIGCVSDYWGGCYIDIIETQKLYELLNVSNSEELLDLLYKADNNDNIKRKQINPGTRGCPFIFELPDFKGNIRSYEYSPDELNATDMIHKLVIGEFFGINTKTNEKVHLTLTVF